MSHVKAAKDALDHAVTTYKCSKKALSKTVNGDKPVSERTLTIRMKNLEDALAALNSAHTTWTSKADFTSDQLKQETYNAEWLEKEWDEISDLQELFEDKLSLCTADTAPPVKTNAQKLQVLQKEMQTLQADIKTTIDQLMSRTSEPVTGGLLKVCEEMLSDVKQCLHVTFSDLLQSILALSSDRGTTLDQYEQFQQTYLPHLVTIQLHLAECTEKPSEAIS